MNESVVKTLLKKFLKIEGVVRRAQFKIIFTYHE